MPYSITTKDGITIRNIPDDVPRDSQSLKDRVAKIRANRSDEPAPAKEEVGLPAKEEAPEPTALREAGIAFRGGIKGAPSALGGVVGAKLGGSLGLLGGPAAPITAPLGTILGGVLGSVGADYLLADKATELAERYLPKPATEAERLLETGTKTAVDVGSMIGAGRALVRKAAGTGLEKVGQFMAAQPLSQLAAGEAASLTSEATDNPLLGVAAGLAAGTPKAIVERIKFPQAAAAQTLDEIKSAATDAYKRAKNAGVVITKDAATNLADSLKSTMNNLGFDEDAHDIIKPIVKMINKRSDKEMSLSDLDTFRRALNTRVKKAFAAEGGGDDARIGSAVVETLDNFIDRLDSSQLSAGNANVAVQALNEARNLWTQKSKMQTVQDILETAERTGNLKEIKKGFTRIAKNKNLINKFSPEEQKVIGKIVKGDAIDLIKSAAPGVTASGLSKGAAWGLLGYFLPTIAAVGGIGAGAVKLATMGRDKKTAEALSELISRGYAPPKFSWSKAIAPSVSPAIRGAAAPEEEPERKAIGGLASLKKRYA